MACGTGLDEQEADLRRILAEDRRAHLEGDPEAIVEHLADSVVSVEDGRVTVLSRDDVRARFRHLFATATYRKWEDLEEPRLRLDPDGDMALVVRRVVAEVERLTGEGIPPRTERFESAWTATYESRERGWVMTTVTSTFLPEAGGAVAVLDAARRAVGIDGSAASIEAVQARAEVRGPGERFSVEILSARDGRARVEFIPGLVAVLDSAGSSDSWVRKRPATPPTPPTQETIAFLRGHEVFMNILFPETRFGPLRASGRASFEGRPAVRLSGLDRLGTAIDFFYAESDSLPLGYRLEDPDPEARAEGRPPVRLVVERWVRRAGVLVPLVASFRQGEERHEYAFVRIVPLAQPPDSAFGTP